MENNLRFLDFITDSHYTSKSILSFRNESQTYYEPYLPIKYILDSNEQDHFLSSLVDYLFATLEFVTDKSCNLIDLTDRFIFCPAGSDSIDSSASLRNLNQQRLCHLLTASGVDEQPADSINMRENKAISWDRIKMGFITFVCISLAKILSYVHTYLQGNLGNTI